MELKKFFYCSIDYDDLFGNNSIVKFDLPSSIVAIQISSWMCFGIPWSHIESFNGPWFEIDGSDGIVARTIREHIDSILLASIQPLRVSRVDDTLPVDPHSG